MIVEVAAGKTRLLDADDFTSFKLVTDDASSLGAADAVARADEQHAWVRIDALRRLAGGAATPAWEESLAGMLDFARSRGWVDDELDAVRAHVEPLEG